MLYGFGSIDESPPTNHSLGPRWSADSTRRTFDEEDHYRPLGLEPTAAPVAPVDCTLWSRTFIKNMDVMFFPMCDDLVYFFHMFDVYFLHMFDVYFLDMFESKD